MLHGNTTRATAHVFAQSARFTIYWKKINNWSIKAATHAIGWPSVRLHSNLCRQFEPDWTKRHARAPSKPLYWRTSRRMVQFVPISRAVQIPHRLCWTNSTRANSPSLCRPRWSRVLQVFWRFFMGFSAKICRPIPSGNQAPSNSASLLPGVLPWQGEECALLQATDCVHPRHSMHPFGHSKWVQIVKFCFIR